MDLISIDRPLSLILLAPVIIHVHLTHINYVRIISFLSVLLFAFGNIFVMQKNYIDLWGVSVYLICLMLYIFFNKNKQNKLRIFNQEHDVAQILYDRDFKNYFTKEEFDTLFRNCIMRYIRKKNKLFAAEGGPFDKIYYFAFIPKNAFVSLKMNSTLISYIREGSWLGTVEFILQFFDDSQRKWLVEAQIDNISDVDLVYLEWDKNVL